MTSSARCKCSLLILVASALAFADECCYPPLARAYPSECAGALLFIDPLLWMGQFGGSQIAITSGEETLFSDKKSHVQNLNFNLDWGIRVGVGYNSCFDGWEALLVWTSFQTEAKRSLSSNFPSRGFNLPAATDAHGKWKLSYQTLDLENARQFFAGNCFILRPHAGLRSAWINQKEFNISYTLTSSEEKISQHDRSWGIGIRGGLDMQWLLSSNLRIFTSSAGSLLYTYHSVKNNTIHNFFHIGNAIFDMQIGLRYIGTFTSSCFSFDLGWENHWLPNQNQFMLFITDAMPGKFVQNQGDLSTAGLFFRVRLDF